MCTMDIPNCIRHLGIDDAELKVKTQSTIVGYINN